MNKEAILEKARNEYSGEDEFSQSVRKNGSLLALTVGAQMCVFFLITHRIKHGTYDPVPAAIYFAMLSAHLLYRGVKLKLKKTIAGGAILAAIALALTVVYVISLIK